MEGLTSFERRKEIVEMLRRNSSVKVSALADHFEVSETTIRNDLSVLEDESKLRRIHGGAVPAEEGLPGAALGIGRRFINAEAKKRIARWAADMVQDGDSILMDASTTVMSMAPFLLKYRNLTIVTTGVETARVLAESPTHTVVLVGGIVDSDGRSITSLIGVPMLENLHFNSAFISCVGLSIENGLTERNLEEARLKVELLSRAQQTVALVDSSKLGRVSLAPFADLSEMDFIVTDNDADRDVIDRIKDRGISVTVCGEDSVRSYNEQRSEVSSRIGFANLSEDSEFPVDVRRGLERAVQEAENIDLMVVDNQLDPEQALRAADQLIEHGVDLAIEYQIDYRTGSLLMKKFNRENIPVIAVDIPIIGATFFGVDNYHAGHMAGVALGEWVNRNWDGELDHLLVLIEPRAGSLPETRIHGQLDGFKEVYGPLADSAMTYLDSGNTTEVSYKQALRALNDLGSVHRIGVLSFNDDSAMGALKAARELDREQEVSIVGQGADRPVRGEIRRSSSSIIGSTAYFPEGYGDKLLNLARRILAGEPVAPAHYMEHVFIHSENINIYYPE